MGFGRGIRDVNETNIYQYCEAVVSCHPTISDNVRVIPFFAPPKRQGATYKCESLPAMNSEPSYTHIDPHRLMRIFGAECATLHLAICSGTPIEASPKVYRKKNGTAGQPAVKTEFMKRIDRDQLQESVIGCHREEGLNVSVHDAVQENMAESSDES